MNREASLKAALELLVIHHWPVDSDGNCAYCHAPNIDHSTLGKWGLPHAQDCPIKIGLSVLGKLREDDEKQKEWESSIVSKIDKSCYFW